MIVLSIDPGEKTSGYVLYDSDRHCVFESASEAPNIEIIDIIKTSPYHAIVCERPAAMGQPLSSNLVETTIWCGVFWATAEFHDWHWLTRNQTKVAIVGRCQGVKDAHVLTGVQERFGGRKACCGTKKNPGPCYGVSGHAWQALACAVAWVELQLETSEVTDDRPGLSTTDR